MTSCRLMTVCVLLFVAWLSTTEGACRNRCMARCKRPRVAGFYTVAACRRQCDRLAKTCAVCFGPRRCLRCLPSYVPTSRFYYVARRYSGGRRCVPNKCLVNNGGCDSDQKCARYWTNQGTVAFKCVCNTGLVWNGISCAEAVGNLANAAVLDSTDVSSRIVDGNTNTKACSNPQSDYPSWVAIALGEPSLVSAIIFYNEITFLSPSDGHTLDGVNVGLSNSAPTPGNAYTYEVLCDTYDATLDAGDYGVVQCPTSATTYTYVVLVSGQENMPLCVAEVEAYNIDPSAYAVGCYLDPLPYVFNVAAWFDPAMTSAKCIIACHSRNYKYAGLKLDSDCYCANSYTSLTASDVCVLPCSGNPEEFCGGGDGSYDYTVVNVLSTGLA